MSFAVAQYRATKTVTASPARVLVQLYDGALKYLQVGAEAIAERDPKAKGVALGKAHRIVCELQASLDEKQAPELCQQLYGLYDFCLLRITEANARWDAQAVKDATKVLETLRSAWTEIADEMS